MLNLREKLKSKELLFGAQIFTGSKEIAEIYGSMDYDFVFLCAEHTPYGIETIRDLVKYTESGGTPALVRLPELDKTFTKKVVDMGASGVLFSMIKSKEDAKTALDMCLYPPYGKRGVGPMAATTWEMQDTKEFVLNNNENGSVRMLQIEHIDMVKDLDEIASNPYIDAFIFGPSDFAASMGYIMDFYHPEVEAEIRRACKILDKHNKRYGLSFGLMTDDRLKYWRDMGMTIFSIGSDFAYAKNGALNALETLRKLK